MFDLGACSYLNIAVAARVSCGSLRALKTLLESFVRADAQAVVEAQHAFRRSSNTYRTKRDTIGTTRLTHCVAHECFSQSVFTSMLEPSIVWAEDTGLPFPFQPEYQRDVHEGSSHRDWIRRRVREA
jgi:hypothetical protein